MAAAGVKEKDLTETDDPVVLRARIRELEQKVADAPKAPAPRVGWKILTPIANYSTEPAHPMLVPGAKGQMVEVRFMNGESFVEDEAAARHLCSSYGYFSEPAFKDIDVHPTYIDAISREVRNWIDPKTGKYPTTTAIPEGYERRYMVRQ